MTNQERIVKLYRTFGAIVSRPKDFVGHVLEFGESGLKKKVAREYGLGGGLPTIDLLDLFPEFDEIVTPYTYLEGGSSAIDLAVLKALAKRYRDCRYFEFGAWRGESVANVASVAKECISLSLSDEQIREAGWSEAFVNTARCYSIALKNVVHLGHNSKTYDFTPYYGTIDLVFVDGDHSYDGVRSDTENAFRLLRDQRSVIVWHDYMRSPEQDVLWGVFAGILDGAPRSALSHLSHISNTVCAAYCTDFLRTQITKFPTFPNKTFGVRIAAKRGLAPLAV